MAEVALSNLIAPETAHLSGGLSGPLGASTGSGNVKLTAESSGTRVEYNYEIVITGKVASIGGRMLEGAAKIVVSQFFERLVNQIEGKAVPFRLSFWQRFKRMIGIGST